LFVVVATLALSSASRADPPARLIKITAQESLHWDVNEITAQPGERLRVALTAVGSMPKIAMAHDFVLLAPGTDVKAFLAAGATMPQSDYIAPSSKDKILVKSPFAGAGETVYANFTAPAKPGKYDYVCTFPAHAASGMRGTLIVK
jgi:azurin